MKYILPGFVALVTLVSVAFLSKNPGQKFTIAWEDGFNSEELDPNNWTPIIGDGCPNLCGFGNNELQYYTDRPQNLRVENGQLIIEAHRESFESRNYTSAKLVTKGKADWKYGRIEVRAKLPYGRGTWPAIWMLPTKEKMNWPLDGEIDIMEHVGYNMGEILGTIHTKKYNHMVGTQKGESVSINDPEEFHLYGIEWNPGAISWFVDDETYFTLTRGEDGYQGWPFDENEYHLILNLAVGGNLGGKEGIDESIWPQKFVIDYVKYFKS